MVSDEGDGRTPAPGGELNEQPWDVFISYSRRDEEFTRRLTGALTDRGRRCWVDWRDISATADWMEEIEAAIDATRAFIFIVSPDSVRSSTCRRELDHAVTSSKRILPVVTREPGEADVPKEVARRNWIFLRRDDDFAAGLSQLEGALDTEPEWAATHTRLLVRAREWERSGRDPSHLLRGNDLRAAEDWLARSHQRVEPQPSPLHTEHVIASRRAATRAQRTRTAVLAVALVIAAVLSFIAIGQRNRAEDQARVAHSRELAARALLIAKTQPFAGLVVADEATRIEPTEQAVQALRQTLQQTASAIAVIRGIGAKVNGVALDQGGKRIAVAADDGTVTLWTPEGEPKGELDTGADSVRSASFSANGQRLALGLGRRGIQIWNPQSERLVRRIATPQAVRSVALSPDGSAVAAGGVRGAALWRAGDPAPTQLGRRGLVFSVAFSPDGRRVLTGGLRGVAELFRAGDGRLLRTLDVSAQSGGDRTDVNGVAFSTDGELATTADQSGRAIVWDLSDGDVVASVHASRDELTTATLSGDGMRLLTAGFDNDAKLWKLNAAGRGGARLLATLKGHDGAIPSAALSRDGRLAVTGSADDTVRTWNADPDDSVATVPAGPAIAVSYNGDGSELLTVEQSARLWTPDGRRVAALHPPRSVQLLLDGEYSADGRLVATTDFDRPSRVRVWQLPAARQILSIAPPPDANSEGAEITPGDTRVIAAYDNGAIRITDISTGATVGRLRSPSTVRSIDLSPDGSLLAAGSDEGPVWIWDLNSRKLIATLEGHSDYVGNVRFNADGSRLISVSDDRTAIIWDVATGAPVAKLIGHTAPVSDGDFSPDSTYAVTSSEDGTVRAWDAATGAALETFNGFPSFVYGVDYSPDGRSIAAGGAYADVVRIFECDLCVGAEDLAAQAEARLNATVTPEQRRDALAG